MRESCWNLAEVLAFRFASFWDIAYTWYIFFTFYAVSGTRSLRLRSTLQMLMKSRYCVIFYACSYAQTLKNWPHRWALVFFFNQSRTSCCLSLRVNIVSHCSLSSDFSAHIPFILAVNRSCVAICFAFLHHVWCDMSLCVCVCVVVLEISNMCDSIEIIDVKVIAWYNGAKGT